MNPLRLVPALAAALCLCVVTFATTVIPPTFDELVERSESVLRSRVASTRCEWRGEGEDRRIVTVVSLAVSETIVGTGQPVVELELLGGEIGGERLTVTGQTRFTPGGEDFLFISRQRSSLTPLVRMMYGRYLVEESASGHRFIARDNGVPLASTDEIATTMTARPPGVVLAQIAAGRILSPSDFGDAVRASARRLGRTDVTPSSGGQAR